MSPDQTSDSTSSRSSNALTDGLRLARRGAAHGDVTLFYGWVVGSERSDSLRLGQFFFFLNTVGKHTRLKQKRRQQLSHAGAGCKYGSVAVNPSQETEFAVAAMKQTESRDTERHFLLLRCCIFY